MEIGDPDGISDEERQLVEMGDVETIQDVTARLNQKPSESLRNTLILRSLMIKKWR